MNTQYETVRECVESCQSHEKVHKTTDVAVQKKTFRRKRFMAYKRGISYAEKGDGNVRRPKCNSSSIFLSDVLITTVKCTQIYNTFIKCVRNLISYIFNRLHISTLQYLWQIQNRRASIYIDTVHCYYILSLCFVTKQMILLTQCRQIHHGINSCPALA